MTLLEITVAAATLAALMTMSVQMIRAMGGQQRTVERRALAMRTVQALAEQIGNMPWEELTAESAGRVGLPAAVAMHLPNARVRATVHDEPEPAAAKRVTIELQWDGPSGRAPAPAKLTTWVFPEDLPLE
jgi:hypothetical protein